MTKLALLSLSVLMLLAFSTVSSAETIGLDEGVLTVIEDVAPLGAPLTYVSGGNGLTGDGCWAAACLPPSTPAEAANAYDHRWLQFDPAIIWSSASALNQVFAIPGVDHGPIPEENLEFIIWGSNDGDSWEEGVIREVYRDGFDTADTVLGHSDDYTSLWGFRGSYTMFRATSGDHLAAYPNCFSCPEGEIDALTAASARVPEPSTLLFLGSALTGLGLWRRMRKGE